ncbi:MAG: hypothetical protein PHY48_17810 [Candidatus Cloacimonetes bacterium]|nr:hypothetical protein [Candidatus Cloacimonadota bacterium]
MRLEQIIQKHHAEATLTAGVSKVASAVASNTKTASENGAQEADNMMKVASVLGDVIGNRIADVVEARLAQSFGYDAEVMKTASLQDVMLDSMYKVAEQVTGQTAVGLSSTAQAEELQISESAAHHANLAAQAASDAVQALATDDQHTATQMMATAAGSIQTAQQFASRIPNNAAVANHVGEASAIVSEAADIAAAHAGA